VGRTKGDDVRNAAQNFTVCLDFATWKKLKIQAADERRPMSVIVRESIRNYIDLASASNGERAASR
jgi:hypothetical protein